MTMKVNTKVKAAVALGFRSGPQARGSIHGQNVPRLSSFVSISISVVKGKYDLKG